MIDIRILRENPERVKENIRKKFQDEKIGLVDLIIELDKKWRQTKSKADKLRSSRNKVSKEINYLLKKGKKKEAEKLIAEAKSIPKKIEKIEKAEKKLKGEIDNALRKIPNFIHESVPIGKDSSENVVREVFGKPKSFDFEIKNHVNLAEKFGAIDLESSRKTSGHGFYFLKGDLARLHSAVLAYARDFITKKGFVYCIPPFMIRKSIVEGVMSFEEFDNMMYKIDGEDLYLIGTSEHSMIGLFKDKVLRKKDLPILMTSYSPCFRKEKGAHGIEEKGLFRVHQFEKQEMIVVCEPEDSFSWYEKLVEYSVEFFKTLEIPIRRNESCSGDLQDLKAKGEDIEGWSPRQKKYIELGSCSNMTDAQARRLNIKINAGGKNYVAHTLNNTVVASPRVLITILENHQNPDGSVNVPLALVPYVGKKKLFENGH